MYTERAAIYGHALGLKYTMRGLHTRIWCAVLHLVFQALAELREGKTGPRPALPWSEKKSYTCAACAKPTSTPRESRVALRFQRPDQSVAWFRVPPRRISFRRRSSSPGLAYLPPPQGSGAVKSDFKSIPLVLESPFAYASDEALVVSSRRQGLHGGCACSFLIFESKPAALV
jgi:hypothetical protein